SNEIFNVNFSEEDALGASDNLDYSNGKMTVKAAKGKIAWAFYPDVITDSNIDLCVTFKALRETGDNAAASLVFWALQDSKYFGMFFTKTGNGSIAVLGKGGWRNATPDKK